MVNVKEGDLCDKCDGKIIFEETPNLQHYGKLVCLNCDKWFKWVNKPNGGGKRTKTSKYSIQQILGFHKKEKEFCFFCLRTKNQLGFNETITIDHIEELNKGGKDELENLQILCTACHKLKNWVYLYVNKHLNKKEEIKIGVK